MACIHFCAIVSRIMSKKTVGLRIRVEEELRREFVDTCHLLDRRASDVLREFIDRNQAPGQQDLFGNPVEPPNTATRS